METKREWTPIKEYEDILFDYYNGIARITINRERYRNAFTPTTTGEMSDALRICREEPDINVVVLTGAGDKAFCSGGDQNVKGRGGYIGKDGVPRLSVSDHLILPALWDRRRPVRSGSFVASIMRRRLWIWGWSIKWYRWINWKTSMFSGRRR